MRRPLSTAALVLLLVVTLLGQVGAAPQASLPSSTNTPGEPTTLVPPTRTPPTEAPTNAPTEPLVVTDKPKTTKPATKPPDEPPPPTTVGVTTPAPAQKETTTEPPTTSTPITTTTRPMASPVSVSTPAPTDAPSMPSDAEAGDSAINSTKAPSTKQPTTPPTTTATADASSGLSTGTTVGLASGGGLAVAFATYLVVRRKKKKKKKKKRAATSSDPSSKATISTSTDELNWTALQPFKVSLSEITLTKALAAGAFGEVWLGTYHHQVVAVKTCLNNKASRKNLQNFIDELALMGTFSCPYIVTMVAAAWTRPTDLKAVLEYMNLGDLRDFLADTTPATFSWKNKLECALNIAKALVYLKERQVIHRDLKSRNVLLDSERGTKLADFGISREDSENTMTAGVGTYRWMAPEVLTFKYYTIAVDVFSFGVLLSELDTHQIPYTDVRNDLGQPISDTALVGMVLYNGLRPTFSGACLPWLKELALRCMNTVAEDRPEPSEIVDIIESQLR
ncbi:Aste57867_18922 [Aphanomyces stellatus]|uniref:Aste57867_18922 protein n=1 Tax=Aphanomyces stellatus TaxID=120398 RepID=A0A485LC68_9STRA|nr:hypothetical protein As57867_018858 [Aphanomyces stellatus]VFT95654.1 Aste57867_18922 [Aphanomyces stellatus]